MDLITRRALATQLFFTGLVTGALERAGRNDRGQGSVEYVGIILVVAALIAALIITARTTNIDETIIQMIEEAVSGLGS